MISFKRDIYKVRPMPKPTKPVLQRTWFVSESQDSTIDHCLPIVNQVFKVPNTAPVALGEFIYLDIAESNPLVPTNTGSKPNYTISQISTQNPNGTIIDITVDTAGEIVKISNGACNPSLTLVQINLTDAGLSREFMCRQTRINAVKVESSNVSATGAIAQNSQLYTSASTNSNPIPFPANALLLNYTAGVTNYIATGTRSYEISTDGILTNSQQC